MNALAFTLNINFCLSHSCLHAYLVFGLSSFEDMSNTSKPGTPYAFFFLLNCKHIVACSKQWEWNKRNNLIHNASKKVFRIIPTMGMKYAYNGYLKTLLHTFEDVATRWKGLPCLWTEIINIVRKKKHCIPKANYWSSGITTKSLVSFFKEIKIIIKKVLKFR